MKEPTIGFNKEESYHSYYNTEGTVRFGLKDLRLFFEKFGKIFNIDGKLVNQIFDGSINLSNDLTHYDNWITNSNAEILLESDPIIGGSAEIRMIGNGTNTPTFTAFTKSISSGNYDLTLNAINKVVFYYDGTETFYSITVL